jgi:bifunctional pyridoxal-dependent enzyme with beta-cystathionase and maltose regulon repressor activities
MSLNKAFNFPGIGLSWCICTNPDIRKKLRQDLASQASHPNALAYVATNTALEQGWAWHAELIEYLRGNRQLIRDWLAIHDQVVWHDSTATYLAWLDFSKLGWNDVHDHLLNHNLALSAGNQFGQEYSQFARLNFGIPRKSLTEALNKVEKGINA